jgi:hypothetical protein
MPNFSFEDIKTFAAFGGLLLGAANLAITVYDKFLKRGTIQIEVERATAKMLGRGWYAVQLDVILKSHRTKNWVKALYLEHSRNVIQVRVKENGRFETTARLPFRIGLLQEPDDYLELDQTELIERFKAPPDSAVPLKDLSLEEGEQKSFRLVAELETERLPDETLDLPLHGWRLIVDLGQIKASVPVSFKPHYTSPKVPLRQQSKPEGFIDA